MCDALVERVTGQTKATRVDLEVGIVVAASSLLGVDDQPGKLIGHRGGDYGTLPASLVRELAESEQVWMRRLVCDPVDGRLLSMDTTKRRFTGALRKFIVYRDGTSRRPHSDAPIYDIDHIEPHAGGGPTSAANGQGLAKHDHLLRDLPDWMVEAVDGDSAAGVRWTTPTGRSYESRPPPILGHGNPRPPPRQPVIIELYARPASPRSTPVRAIALVAGSNRADSASNTAAPRDGGGVAGTFVRFDATVGMRTRSPQATTAVRATTPSRRSRAPCWCHWC